ncbi:MAG: hypothetical protein LC785_07225 [Acidobacteria bacterium]|nr:hypothetical protein [Acidobacteriota bacterium]
MPAETLLAWPEEVANARAETLSAEGVRRLDRERLVARSGAEQGSGFSGKKNVVLAVVAVVMIVGLAIVLAHNGVDTNVSCDNDPLAPNCIRRSSWCLTLAATDAMRRGSL